MRDGRGELGEGCGAAQVGLPATPEIYMHEYKRNPLQSRSRSAGPARCLNLMLLRDRYCRSSILRCGGRYCTACSLVMWASPTRKAKGLAGGKALGVSLPLKPVMRGLRRVLAGRVY